MPETTTTEATPIEILFEEATAYSKTTIELIRLVAISKTADLLSLITAGLVITLITAVFAVFMNIGVAMWLGEVLGKLYYGYFIVGGFYGLLALLLVGLRKQLIIRPINNAIITLLQKDV